MAHRILFKTFILLIPVQLAYHFWPDYAFVYGIRVDYLAPKIYATDFLFLAFFFVWLLQSPQSWSAIRRNMFYVGLFLIVAAANTALSDLPLVSAYKWLRMFQVWTLFAYLKNQPDPLGLVRAPLFIGSVATLIISVAQILSAGSIGGALYWLGERSFDRNTPGISLASFGTSEFLRPYATFPHPNALGGFYVVVALMFLAGKQWVHKCLALVPIVLVALSFSQNAWAALLLALASIAPLRQIKPSLRLGVVIFMLMSVLVLVAGAQVDITALPKNVQERVLLNSRAGSVFANNPLLGMGLGSFPSVPIQAPAGVSVWLLQPVHNIYLLVLAETGLVAVVLLYFVLSNKLQTTPVVAAILATGLFDHYWLTLHQNMLLLVVAVAVQRHVVARRK